MIVTWSSREPNIVRVPYYMRRLIARLLAWVFGFHGEHGSSNRDNKVVP